jgi:hypothetical protein
MSAPNQPIIVVKKKAGHGGHHGGAWKVAYADFVTAMMAFFLVMWLVGQSQAVKAGVGGYFRDPVVFEATGGRGVLPGADSVEEPKPQTPASAENEKQRLEAVVLHIKEGLAVEPAFEKLRDQIEFTVTPEGLRIDLIEKDDSTFFDSGSASIRGETGHVFGVIATELAKLDYKIDLHRQPWLCVNRALLQLGTVGGSRQHGAACHGEKWAERETGDERSRFGRSTIAISERSVQCAQPSCVDSREKSDPDRGRAAAGSAHGQRRWDVGTCERDVRHAV